MVGDVDELLHEYVPPPPAVSTVEVPLQMEFAPVIVAAGGGVFVKRTLLVLFVQGGLLIVQTNVAGTPTPTPVTVEL